MLGAFAVGAGTGGGATEAPGERRGGGLVRSGFDRVTGGGKEPIGADEPSEGTGITVRGLPAAVADGATAELVGDAIGVMTGGVTGAEKLAGGADGVPNGGDAPKPGGGLKPDGVDGDPPNPGGGLKPDGADAGAPKPGGGLKPDGADAGVPKPGGADAGAPNCGAPANCGGAPNAGGGDAGPLY